MPFASEMGLQQLLEGKHLGFLVTQTVKTLLAMQETRFDPWVGKIPWRKAWQPTLVFLPAKSYGQRSLVGYSPQGLKESNYN